MFWFSHLGFGWGGWGGQKRHWCWEQGWDPWTQIITWLSHLGFGWGVGTKAFMFLCTQKHCTFIACHLKHCTLNIVLGRGGGGDKSVHHLQPGKAFTCNSVPLASRMSPSQRGKPLTCSMRLFAHITCCGMEDGGWAWGRCGVSVCVCVKRSSLLLAQRIYATPWADLLLHLHTNMISRYHIFSWRGRWRWIILILGRRKCL